MSKGVQNLINQNKGIIHIQEMPHKQPGFDYVTYNKNNVAIKGEHKDREKGVKVDITPYQHKCMKNGSTKIITLMTKHDEIQYHMKAETYLNLGNKASGLRSGYKGKSWEVNQKDFINNAYTNFYEFVNNIDVEDNIINLETFMT